MTEDRTIFDGPKQEPSGSRDGNVDAERRHVLPRVGRVWKSDETDSNRIQRSYFPLHGVFAYGFDGTTEFRITMRE